MYRCALAYSIQSQTLLSLVNSDIFNNEIANLNLKGHQMELSFNVNY